MVAPALIALYRIRAHEIDPARAHGGRNKHNLGVSASSLHPLFANRPLRLFAGCAFLFHLANAAMLPLAASMLTLRSSQSATILVATSIVVPQFIVAALSPAVGRKAQQWGRRPLLVLAFGALSIRGVLFALVVNPELLVAVQFLDAISAAVLGVLVPLTVADVSRGTGHFNLAQGVIGCAVGIGAAVSTAIVGYLNDRFGSQTAFVNLACIAAFGFVFVWMVMPETRPRGNSD
jgi:MFS family permease